MAKTIIRIKPDGSTEIEGTGYTDGSCRKAAEPYERALGAVGEQALKPEALIEEPTLDPGETEAAAG